MAEPQQSDLSVQSVSQDGKAPKRRISTVSAAMTANQSMMTAYRQGGRDVRFALIAGLFAGFPPVPPSEMERQGMGDMPNVNTRGFEAAVMDYADVWNSINSSNLDFAEIKAEHPDPMEAERRGKVLTECFNWALGVWNDPPKDGFFNQSGKYIIESATRDIQMGLFSIGVSMWRDPIDFRPTTIPTRSFRVPMDTKITLENCDFACVDDDMSASQLWQMRDKKGWSKEQITRVIYANQGARGILNNTRSTYAQWVEWVRSNESFVLNDFYPIPFIHIYTREFDGRISHCCFSEIQPGVDYGDQGKKEADAFLYDAPEKDWVSTWDQAVALFSDSVGAEGRFHGAKGFGDRNFDMSNVENFLFNMTARSSVINNMLMFQSSGEADRQKLDQIVFTNGAILTPELQIAQTKMNMDINAAMGMFELSSRVRNMNNRKFPIGEKSKSGEVRTATEVSSDAAKEAQFTNLQVSFYRSTGLDKLLAEIFRRIAQPGSKYPESWPGGKVAKKFREKCKEQGIPEDELLNVYCVRANRNGGSGSMAIDLMKAKELLAVATPGKGMWNARYEVASALKGAYMAEVFVEPLPEQPTEMTRLITNENLFISDGKIPQALPNDAHEVHIPAHVELLSELQKVVMAMQEQGVTPDTLDDAVLLSAKVAAGIQHTGQHVQFLSEMPEMRGQKALFGQIVLETAKILNELTKMNEGLEKEIEKVAMEAQQQQAQQSPEIALAQMKAQVMQIEAEARIKTQEMIAQAKIAIDSMKQQVKAETSAQMKLEQHQLDMGLQAERTVSEMEQTRAKGMEQRLNDASVADQKLREQAASATISLTEQAAIAAEKMKKTSQ